MYFNTRTWDDLCSNVLQFRLFPPMHKKFPWGNTNGFAHDSPILYRLVDFEPFIVYRWGYRGGVSVHGDVPDDTQRLLGHAVHTNQLVSPLGLFSRLFHQ